MILRFGDCGQVLRPICDWANNFAESRVILVPSSRDVMAEAVFPTPPLHPPTFLPHNVTMLSNPTTFSLGQVLVAPLFLHVLYRSVTSNSAEFPDSNLHMFMASPGDMRYCHMPLCSGEVWYSVVRHHKSIGSSRADEAGCARRAHALLGFSSRGSTQVELHSHLIFVLKSRYYFSRRNYHLHFIQSF